MHKTGIIPKATPLGSGSHHGLFVLRFIPHPSLLCFGVMGVKGVQAAYAPRSASVLQDFLLRNERPQRSGKQEYFSLLCLWCLPNNGCSALLKSVSFVVSGSIRPWAETLPLPPFSLGVWIPAAANFWVTFCILLLSFFWHLWKRFLQQIPSDLNRVLPLSRLDFKWYFQGRMLGTTVWHLELMWLHRYNKGMATTGGRGSWHLPVQHPQCAGNCAGYRNLVRTKTYTTSNSQRIIIWVTKKLLYNSELL